MCTPGGASKADPDADPANPDANPADLADPA